MAWVLVVFLFELGVLAICACVLGARREREARMDYRNTSGEDKQEDTAA